MIAIKSVPHLYKRGDKFYLRIVLPKAYKSSECWLSLKTSCYKLARHLILKISKHIEALKLLNAVDVSFMERLYREILDRMKKDLDYEIIDSLCNEYETKTYESSMPLKHEFTEFPSSEDCSPFMKQFLSLAPRNDKEALIRFDLQACHLDEIQLKEDLAAYKGFSLWRRNRCYELGYGQLHDETYHLVACPLHLYQNIKH